MICGHVELTIDTLEPRDIAKAMLKFWLYQAEQARQQHAATSIKVDHAKQANKEAERQYKDSDDLGFGPILPFSQSEIDQLTNRVPPLKKNLDEANAMAGYFINFITDKAHPDDQTRINNPI
jgi:hypothetical protein